MDKDYDLKFEKEITLMMKQLLFVLNEFCIQPVENIVRLGCACLRHFVLGAGDYFTTKQWDLISFSLHRACAVSLHPLTRVSMTYSPFSDSFYGDLAAGIKVAARRDSTVDDNLHLKQLSQQVRFYFHIQNYVKMNVSICFMISYGLTFFFKTKLFSCLK